MAALLGDGSKLDVEPLVIDDLVGGLVLGLVSLPVHMSLRLLVQLRRTLT